MESELKPVRCGCGGEAKVISYLSREYCKMAYYVRCVECGTETDDLHSEAEAITAWNRAMGADAYKTKATERTAKVVEGQKGSWYCTGCGKWCDKGEDIYCAHCGCRLEWE